VVSSGFMETRKAEILKELDEKFAEFQKVLGFKASLDELDSAFFIKDTILSSGFVSEAFSRQLSHRIMDTYNSWMSYLHNIVMPNPHNLVSANETKMFSEDDKKEMLKLMGSLMAFSAANSYLGLTKDKVAEGKFIDDAYTFWNSEFQPAMSRLVKKTKDGWEEKGK